MSRAENGEALLGEIVGAVGRGELRAAELPPGWMARVEAQLKALEILRRDQARMFERPPEGETWETLENGAVRAVQPSPSARDVRAV